MGFNLNDRILARIDIKLDKREIEYIRRIETIFETLEKIGGFKESMMIIGFILSFFIQ